MADIIATLHPENDAETNLYPNIKKENIPNKSIGTDKLTDDVLSLIGSLKPSGVTTSTVILAKTSDDGIWVASDNGHWYYWDGTEYVDGGVYQATEVLDNSITENKLSTNLQEKINVVNSFTRKKCVQYLDWEFGSIGTVTPGDYFDDTTTRIRTSKRYHILPGSSIKSTNVAYSITYYNRYGEYITSSSSWITGVTNFYNESYVAILLQTGDFSAIDDLEIKLYEPVTRNKDILFCQLNDIGDCIVIKDKNISNEMPIDNPFMIDCGGVNDYSRVKRFLLRNNIRTIGWFLISHYHNDHTGNFETLLNDSDFDFSGCVFILPPTPPSSYLEANAEVRIEYNKVINTLNDKGYTAIVTVDALRFKEMFTYDYYIKFYNTNHTSYYANNVDYNNMSVVAKVELNNFKILFTGDLARTGQTAIKNNMSYVDVLKVPHHGLDVLSNMDLEWYNKLGSKLYISSSPFSASYNSYYTNSGQIKYALANNIANVMSGKENDKSTQNTGYDLTLTVCDSTYTINGYSYYETLTDSEFKTIKSISN